MNEAKVRDLHAKWRLEAAPDVKSRRTTPVTLAKRKCADDLEAALADEPGRSEHKLAVMWRKALDARSKIAPKSDYERGRDAQFKVCIEELEATERGQEEAFNPREWIMDEMATEQV